MRVIGIDPGLATVGYGIVENGDTYRELIVVISGPCWFELPRRLLDIYHSIKLLLRNSRPTSLPWKTFFVKTVKLPCRLESLGAIMIAAAEKLTFLNTPRYR